MCFFLENKIDVLVFKKICIKMHYIMLEITLVYTYKLWGKDLESATPLQKNSLTQGQFQRTNMVCTSQEF